MRFKEYLILEAMSKLKAMEVFGIKDKKTAEEIKKLYRQLATKYHPDRGGSEEKMKEINAAYEILKNGATPAKDTVNWDDIHAQYKVMCQQVNERIEKIFKPKVYETYLNSVLDGYNFKLSSITYYGEEYYKSPDKNYGSPTYAGIKAIFDDDKNNSSIEINFMVHLPSLKKASGLTDNSNAKYPLNVNAIGFIAGRKFKLFDENWKSVGITDAKINDPESILPKTKLKKQLMKQAKTKATKKDFLTLISKVLKAERMDDGSFMVPIEKDYYLGLDRGTMMRKGYWNIGIYEKANKYSYKPVETLIPTAFESPELLDLFMSFKGKKLSQIKNLVKQYKKEQGV
jgi:curved DNA-binding protein CbpA